MECKGAVRKSIPLGHIQFAAFSTFVVVTM